VGRQVDFVHLSDRLRRREELRSFVD
jgi:hypothetical protein